MLYCEYGADSSLNLHSSRKSQRGSQLRKNVNQKHNYLGLFPAPYQITFQNPDSKPKHSWQYLFARSNKLLAGGQILREISSSLLSSANTPSISRVFVFVLSRKVSIKFLVGPPCRSIFADVKGFAPFCSRSSNIRRSTTGWCLR